MKSEFKILDNSILSSYYYYPLSYTSNKNEIWHSVRHYIEGLKYEGTIIEEKIKNSQNLDFFFRKSIVRDNNFMKNCVFCYDNNIISVKSDWDEEKEMEYLFYANNIKLKYIPKEFDETNYTNFIDEKDILNGYALYACLIFNKIKKREINLTEEKILEIFKKEKINLLELNILQINLICKNLKIKEKLKNETKLILISLLYNSKI